jgi:hypothetical protein
MKARQSEDPKSLVSIVSSTEGFDWDEGNKEKNKEHGVDWQEIEQVFFDRRLLVFEDAKHSEVEARFIAYGKTSEDRILTVVFTIRKNNIRPISARDSSKKEIKRYEEKEAQENSNVQKRR